MSSHERSARPPQAAASASPEVAADLRAPTGIDHLGAFADASAEDLAVRDRARELVAPMAEELADAWHTADYPVHLVQQVAAAGLITDGVEVPGLPRLSPLAAGFVAMEVSRVDGSLAAACAVQGGLALRAVADLGSEAQRERLLHPLATGELLGAFALTEPDHGSDSVALGATARRDGDDWVLDGRKKWIGNGSAGGVTVVWARDEDSAVRGFLVPQQTPGYTAVPITEKGSLRGIHQSLITLEGCRISDDARLPGANSFADAAAVLIATRVNVGWSALGHAVALFDAALSYARTRVQFGRVLGAQQMVQERLAQMLETVTSMQLQAAAVARAQDAGVMTPTQASMLKYHNTRGARRVAQIARDMLGGNGILLEHGVAQHFADVEALHTYEGTESVQALLLGRELTGTSAFGWG